MMKKDSQFTATLNNGVVIPYLGLGTWLSKGEQCEHAVQFALTHGYDHIDTARAYGNERQVGRGWQASGRPRDEIFITTKIQNADQGYQSSINSFKDSLHDLQTDYVDLLLIHWPSVGEFQRTVETWQGLIDLQADGFCRSIGVSNFTIPLTEKLLQEIPVIPAVNQVEFHTFLFQKELLNYCREKGIQLEAYSPIARAKFLDHDELLRIAEKYEKSPAQVMLAWCVNHDIVVIPKSVHEKRILENAKIFFELDDDDMKLLDNLDTQTRLVRGGPFV